MVSMISSTAIFASSNIEATLEYYKNVLGFESTWMWGDPPSFGSATRGGVSIMFNIQTDLVTKVRGHQHWINVDDIDELYHLHNSNGAHIVSAIEDKPWGRREYTVEDLNGYHLRFAGLLSNKYPQSVPFPTGVIIERRKPTRDEYANVAGQVFNHKNLMPGLLEKTWGGVIALSPDGETIGILRIMWDAPGWFSIWDVAVLPDWQARRIGSHMMKEALALVQEVFPGAIVYLFTYKHAFYERLGFTKESVSVLRL